ncbi:MAG TPA: glycolate oxidase subunit GlcE [Crenotrichaceae bacterium]|nr:glycolate oxidase subunit GlcE [Crenotrichaceae bacterium]
MTDLSSQFQQQIREAVENENPVNLVGGNSKSFYGREARGDSMHVAGNKGIIDYEPTELVVTVRNGTALHELESVLAEQGQMLGFEPPCYQNSATVGGAIAAGLSGSRRPFSGAVRDYVLGCKLINGYADILSFGGTAMKNVAGYDLSRLMVGSMGSLGLILETSLRVVPMHEMESTWCQEVKSDQVIGVMSAMLQKPLPISGLYYDGARLFYRLYGTADAIAQSANTLGGEEYASHDQLWSDLNHQKSDFFQDKTPLWRISVAPATEQLPLSGQCVLDWGGALRWLKTDEPAEQVFQTVADVGGHATLFREGKRDEIIFQPLPPDLMQIQQRLKQAFDPMSVFNLGRMYPEF